MFGADGLAAWFCWALMVRPAKWWYQEGRWLAGNKQRPTFQQDAPSLEGRKEAKKRGDTSNKQAIV
jgi:hypothetical protein